MGNQRAEVFELLVFCTEKGSFIWRLNRQESQIRGSTVIGYPINLLSPPGEISSSRPFLPILASRRPT